MRENLAKNHAEVREETIGEKIKISYICHSSIASTLSFSYESNLWVNTRSKKERKIQKKKILQ